ncbi:MAG: iron chelate uptake ABC transporter family permease subunit [Planctomycetota bacterium]|nr:iron chelate uptake ABC transporter family permease subunit [Planctomycetota bacterium]
MTSPAAAILGDTSSLAAEVWRVLTLRAGINTTTVLIGTTLLGIAGGVAGSFALLRKRALMSDALSHATLPGVALAFILAVVLGFEGRSLPWLLTGAALSGVLGVLTVHAIKRGTRLPEDAAIGAVLSVFFGAGIVLLSVIQTMQTGSQGGLKSFIYGQTAALQFADAALLGAIALLVIIGAVALLKELALICFDDSFARVGGWPVDLLDAVIMAGVVLVTVAGLHAVGLILVIAMLIVPAAAARLWTDRLRSMLLIAGVIGGVSGYLGSAVSAVLPRSPAGAVIVLTAGAIFLLSLIAAPRRGALAEAARRWRIAVSVTRDHLLRDLLERGPDRAHSRRTILRDLGNHPIIARLVLSSALRRGLVVRDNDALRLTQRGLIEARRLERNHQLWELYLITHADVAASHVDWSADAVEHVLSAELVRELERELARAGVDPPREHAA